MKEVNIGRKGSTHINNLIKFNCGLASVEMAIRIFFWWVTGVKYTHAHTHTVIHGKGTEMIEADESHNMLPIGSWEMFPGTIHLMRNGIKQYLKG